MSRAGFEHEKLVKSQTLSLNPPLQIYLVFLRLLKKGGEEEENICLTALRSIRKLWEDALAFVGCGLLFPSL
jgi:hypothetical protein